MSPLERQPNSFNFNHCLLLQFRPACHEDPYSKAGLFRLVVCLEGIERLTYELKGHLETFFIIFLVRGANCLIAIRTTGMQCSSVAM